MSGLLEGCVAVVTGAGSGIGRDLARALAAQGARVAIGVRRIATGEETAALVENDGGKAFPVAMDVTDERQVEQAIAQVVARFGRLDMLIHNANHADAGLPVPADEMLTREKWRSQSRIALGGAFLCARYAYPHLRASERGRLILMSSTFGFHGAAANTIYAAQKAAYRGLIRSLAREWGPDGITVNGICPAAATDATRNFFDQNPAMRDAFIRKFPLGRLGAPRSDIADAIALLGAEATGYMTGQILFLDGGMYPAA